MSNLLAQRVNWQLKNSQVKSSLRGLSVYSEDVVWASGANGTWLRTVDGGETWSHGVIGGLDSVDFRSIHSIDENTAIAVSAGDPAVIYKTKDGGGTWDLKAYYPSPAFLDGISFVDEERGYVFGDPVDGKWMVLVTEDAGESWGVLETAPKPSLGEAAFAASASSILAFQDYIWIGSGGSNSNIWESEDQGLTWNSYKSPLLQGEPAQGIFSICLIKTDRILAVGGDYTKPGDVEGNSGIFSISEKKWIVSEDGLSGYRSGVTFVKGKELLIAVGTNGSDISMDLGETWDSFSNESFHAVKSDKGGKSVWASGPNGKLAVLRF